MAEIGTGYFEELLIPKSYDYKDKERNIGLYVSYMLDRTQAMFEYEGLPDTIKTRELELMLQTYGFVCWAKNGDDLYVFRGGLGGKPDPYYRPTTCIVANPALNLNKTFNIYRGNNEGDCVIMRNDSLKLGLLPMFNKYAKLLVENELSIYIADIMSRSPSLISANDDNTYESALDYLNNLENGDLGVVLGSVMMDEMSIKTQPLTTTANNTIQNLIELEQYTKASWYNELGLNANYNMKREAIAAGESQLNFDALLPFVDQMLHEREEALELVNELFGTNITVKLHSAWEMIQEKHEEDTAEDEITNEGIDAEEMTEDPVEEPAEEQTEPEEMKEEEGEEDDKEKN